MAGAVNSHFVDACGCGYQLAFWTHLHPREGDRCDDCTARPASSAKFRRHAVIHYDGNKMAALGASAEGSFPKDPLRLLNTAWSHEFDALGSDPIPTFRRTL